MKISLVNPTIQERIEKDVLKMNKEKFEEWVTMLKRIMNEIPMAGVILDRSETIEFCNRSLLEMTGWSGEEVAGNCWFETFIHGRDRMKRKSEYLEAMKSGSLRNRYECMILSRGGGEIGVMWNCAVIRDRKHAPPIMCLVLSVLFYNLPSKFEPNILSAVVR